MSHGLSAPCGNDHKQRVVSGLCGNRVKLGVSRKTRIAKTVKSWPGQTVMESPRHPARDADSDLVCLSGLQPLARGRCRAVYRHPENPRWLIKIIRPEAPPRDPWYKARRRYGPFLPTLRELKEFLSIHARRPEDQALVENIVGFVQTDLGLGLIVELLTGPGGEPAPTIAALAGRGGFGPAERAALDAFFSRLMDSGLIIGDLHLRNVVYAHDARTGESRFVLVDGIGDKLFIPLNTISRGFNRWTKRRRIHRMRKAIDILQARTK